MNFLRRCRRTDKMISFKKKLSKSIFILILGLALGMLATWSKTVTDDGTIINHLISTIELSNIMSRIAFWAIISVMISIDANSPLRAIINIALFFLGAFGGYYIYTVLIINNTITINIINYLTFAGITSLLGMIIWYAKGEGWLSVLISALVIAFFIREAFDYGTWYFGIDYIFEVIVFIWSIIILYSNFTKTIITLFYSLPIAVVYEIILPYI
jgi:hypothetical protein